MEVTYTTTFQDRLVGYRTGLAYMTMLARFVWAIIALLVLTLPALDPISHHHLITWLLTTRPSLRVFVNIGLLASASLSGCLIGGLTVTQLTKTRTVKLQERHLLNKTLWWNSIRWRNVTNIVETAEHICFCQNGPFAIVVPKSAFPNAEQASAFLEQAERYWRRETGTKDSLPPDAAGVWPPAPRGGR